MNAKQIFVIAIIAMFLVVPFASAKQESVDVGTVKQDKKIEEKAVDKTKEQPKEVKNKDKEITGKITVTDSNTSAYTVTKEGNAAIKIKKNGEHTKAKVAIPKTELQKIDKDGDKKFGVLHIADDGTVTHSIYTEEQLAAGTEMTFSENIVNGYYGYYEKTQIGVTSGTVIDIPDVSGSDYYITASVNGIIPTYSSGINIANTVGYWPLNGSWADISGHGYTMTPTGSPTFVTAIRGSGAQFAGTNYATVTINNTLGANSFAYSFWTRMTNTSHENTFISKNYAPTTPLWFRYVSGAFRATLQYNGSASYCAYTPSSPTSYQHIFVTYNKTDSTLNLFVNGILRQSTSVNTSRSYVNTNPFYMAERDGTPTIRLTGILDEVGIYNYAPNNATIRQNYAGGSGISFQPEPSYNFTGYNVASGVEKIIDTDATCTGLEYVDTTGGTHTVTVRVYFTEDATKMTETKGAVYQNVSIIHTKQNATASVGTIVYELDPLYSGTPVLSSNNTNATVSRNDTHAIISTGLIKQGQSFSYAVSVPDNHDHGFHLGNLMKWVGTGWDFVSTAPEDWTNYIGDQIEVTVS